MMDRQKSPSRSRALTQNVPSAQTNIFEILTCNPNVPAQSPLEVERFPSSTASPYPYAVYIGNPSNNGLNLIRYPLTSKVITSIPSHNVSLRSTKKVLKFSHLL
jgi:hypothetical protein